MNGGEARGEAPIGGTPVVPRATESGRMPDPRDNYCDGPGRPLPKALPGWKAWPTRSFVMGQEDHCPRQGKAASVVKLVRRIGHKVGDTVAISSKCHIRRHNEKV